MLSNPGDDRNMSTVFSEGGRLSQNSVRKPNNEDSDGLASEIADSGMHGLQQYLSSTSIMGKVFWGIIVFIFNVITWLQLVFVIRQIISQPTLTKSNYEPLSNVAYPALTICSHNTYMFDLEKLDRITGDRDRSKEIADSMAKMVPFFGNSLRYPNKRLMDTNTSVLSAEEISGKDKDDAKETQGLTALALQSLIEQYLIPCERFFSRCLNGLRQEFNCCEKFFPVYNAMRGLCYSQKPIFPTTAGPMQLSKVYIYLNAGEVCLDKEKSVGCDIHVIYSDSGAEQSPFKTRHWVMRNNPSSHVFDISTKRITTFPNQLCTTITNEQFRHTEVYQNYTLDNCIWSKFMSRKQHTCDLPLLFFQNANLKSTKGICTAAKTLSLAKSFSGIIEAENASAYINVDMCTPKCDRFEYDVDAERFGNMPENSSSALIMYYNIHTYEHVIESTALEWQDYISIVGGTLGTWLGASFVTYIHFGFIGISHASNRFLRRVQPENENPPT